MEKKFYLSETDKKIGGVCGGVAEYLGIDPTVVRILWAAAIICYGFGLIAYLLFWIIAPKKA